MSPVRLALTTIAFVALPSCSTERTKECEKFLSAIEPLNAGTPSPDTVDRVHHDLDSIKFEDQPLEIFAKNYTERLDVLSSTLQLQASPSPPDGTDEVIAAKLKESRVDQTDISRYCSR